MTNTNTNAAAATLAIALRTLVDWNKSDTDEHRALMAQVAGEPELVTHEWADHGDPRRHSVRLRASYRQRWAMERDARTLYANMAELFANRGKSDFQGKLWRDSRVAFLALEQILEGLAHHAVPSDYWDCIPGRPIWSPERIEGDIEAIEAEGAEAAAEYQRLQREIERRRKSLVNRCGLAKAAQIEPFSFRQAWDEWKAFARETGAEAREERAWARACERELAQREREAQRLDESPDGEAGQGPVVNVDGVEFYVPEGELDGGYLFPELKPALSRAAINEMANTPAPAPRDGIALDADEDEELDDGMVSVDTMTVPLPERLPAFTASGPLFSPAELAG